MPFSKGSDARAYPLLDVPAASGSVLRRKPEDKPGSEDREGSFLDVAMEDLAPGEGAVAGRSDGEAVCSDRAELIERLKRGESPQWIPNQSLQEEYLKANGEELPFRPAHIKAAKPIGHLSPAVELQTRPSDDVKSLAMEIKRPRSALHAGDFTEDLEQGETYGEPSSRHALSSVFSAPHGPLGTSPTSPWFSPSTPAASFHESTLTLPSSFRHRDYDDSYERRSTRDRAPSCASSFASNYILKAPTTPLVQQSNNTDLDFSGRDRSTSPDKTSRRHTLPPHALQNIGDWRQQSHSSSYQQGNNLAFVHRSRRSLTSNWTLQQSTSPSTPPFNRSRRTSFSSEASPLQHASMVGSYEESILRGRMSTAPSKPVDFTAQIGVLGRGECKPKCPAHLTIPFPAVYYNWAAGDGRRPIDNEPSPYVGHIDLQYSSSSNLSRVSPTHPAEEQETDQQEQYLVSNTEGDHVHERHVHLERAKKRRRTPLIAPPTGSYRIPEQGQLQIIIKNPNKTAVKLFLVPYDLTEMEPGTKTFIRQRLYSTKPVLGKPEASSSSPQVASPLEKKEKPILRYLIHVNICSPTRGRFYLYQHIRVVFANRVPDDKQQLSTETQVPEPRFSTWKPSSLSGSNITAGAKLTADKAFRRRSSGFGFGDEFAPPWMSKTFEGGSTFPFFSDVATPPVPPIPFNLPTKKGPTASDNGNDESDEMDIDASRSLTASGLQIPNYGHLIQGSGPFSQSSSQGSGDYEKLNRGDSGYGGIFERSSSPEPEEGLLTRRLKSLGAQVATGTEEFKPAR